MLTRALLSLTAGHLIGYLYGKSYRLQTRSLLTTFSTVRLIVLSTLRMLAFGVLLYYILRSQTVHLILFLAAFFVTVGYQLWYDNRRDRGERENGITYSDL